MYCNDIDGNTLPSRTNTYRRQGRCCVFAFHNPFKRIFLQASSGFNCDRLSSGELLNSFVEQLNHLIYSQTLTSDHPPNKGELFRIGAIATLNNILNRYLNNVEVCSYSLKLLHNLLADDVQAKHSIGKAREVCFQLQMTDLILKIRRNFFNNDHILLVSKEILKLIASNFA
jgi:hypothetical protein